MKSFLFGFGTFSLKTKITLLVVFIILAILVSIGYLQIERDTQLHTQYIDNNALTVSRTIISFYILDERRIDYRSIQRFLNRFLGHRELAQDIIYISLQDDENNILAGAVNRAIVDSYRREISDGNGNITTELAPIETSEDMLSFIEKLQRRQIFEVNDNFTEVNVENSGDDSSEVRSIQIGYSKRSLKQQVFNAVMANITIIGAYLLIGIVASYILGGAISRPIKVLEEAMKRVSAGDLNQRLDISSKDEIGTLAATFNYMTEGLREKEKIKREFLVAREVQFNLLPRKVLDNEHLDIATYFEPATEVGGDYYDFVEMDDGSIILVVGDVSGHGMSAGLMMAITKSCLHTLSNFETDVATMMTSMNSILHNLSEQRSMVTMFLSKLDLQNLRLDYANAGHPFTYVVRPNSNGENKIFSLEAISYPLAVKKKLEFQGQSFNLQTGDYLVFYSDGIIEALDDNENVFGFDRIENILKNEQFDDSKSLLETLITEVRIHIGTAEQFDDITAVVVRIR